MTKYPTLHYISKKEMESILIQIHDLKNMIRTIPNFPKTGIQFLDITPILVHSKSFQTLIDLIGKKINWSSIDVVIGVESRGFLLASALATKYNKGLVLCRKAGKLPPPTVSESYKLEYGEATLEMNPGSGKSLIVDDVLATGGTLQAAMKISQKAGYTVEDLFVLINIEFLNQMSFQNQKIKSLFQY